MKKPLFVAATLIASAAVPPTPVSACSPSGPVGEKLMLTLGSVEVDGQPLTDLSAYQGFEVAVQARADGFGSDVVASGTILWARRFEGRPDGSYHSYEFSEYYGTD